MPLPSVPETEEEWLACLPLPAYLAAIPSGKIVPIIGPVIWTDGNGDQMTEAEYILKWGFDPNIAWAAKKEYRKRNGPGVHIVRE